MSNTEADATPKPRVVAQTPRRSADERISPPLPRRARGSGQGRAQSRAPGAVTVRGPRPAGRPNPVDLLEEQAASRVPELVPIRYGRMLVSPFTFYRGGAYLMASDLAPTPISGLNVQLCGDAHLSNFGGFASAERRMVFDINDFDETLPGPWEWDLKRLAASFEIAGRDRGFSDSERREAVLKVARSYREAMRGVRRYARSGRVDAHLDIEALIPRYQKAAGGNSGKALERNLAQSPHQGQHEGSG